MVATYLSANVAYAYAPCVVRTVGLRVRGLNVIVGFADGIVTVVLFYFRPFTIDLRRYRFDDFHFNVLLRPYDTVRTVFVNRRVVLLVSRVGCYLSVPTLYMERYVLRVGKRCNVDVTRVIQANEGVVNELRRASASAYTFFMNGPDQAIVLMRDEDV